MALSTRRIPANVLAAARRAGLKVPDWYVGALIDPDKPRKKTLADITEQVRREEREACEPPNPDVPSEPSESSGRGRSVSREFDALVECQYHGDRDQAGTDRVVEAAKAALAIWDRVGRPGMTTTDYSQMADKMANLRAALDA